MNSGNYDKAAGEFRDELEINPGNAAASYNLNLTYSLMNGPGAD
jgi:hypothetical protein